MPDHSYARQSSQGSIIEGVCYGAIVALLWGGWQAVSFHGIADGMSAWDIALIRYCTAGLLLSPLLVLNKAISGISWRKSLTLSLLAGPLYIVVCVSWLQYLAIGARCCGATCGVDHLQFIAVGTDFS